MFKTKSGFTIIELLIVIVVIGILAAITIVVYNGIQQRARNAQIITTVNAYKKAIFLYAIDNNGGMPYGTRSNVCLGSGYTTNNTCFSGAITGGPAIYDDDATFTANISKYLPSEPVAGGSLISDSSSSSQGVGVGVWTSGRELYYLLYGSGQQCSAGGNASAWNSSTTYCDLILTLPS